MIVVKIICILLLVLIIAGNAVLWFGDIAKMIDKTRNKRATGKKTSDDKRK